MARGGKRDNAGRKAGTPNKATQEQRDKIVESGLTPLDYMLNLLRDDKTPTDRRDWAAEKAAPYVHARLASIEAKHDVTDALADLLKAVDGRTRGIPESR
mgnify:CR=1 FL=1